MYSTDILSRQLLLVLVVGVRVCGGGCKNSKSKVTKVASPFESSRKASKCKGAKAKDAARSGVSFMARTFSQECKCERSNYNSMILEFADIVLANK